MEGLDMSTKIYEAWKVQVSKLKDFTNKIHAHMMKKVIIKVERIFNNFNDEKFIKSYNQKEKTAAEKRKIRKELKNPRHLFFAKLRFIFDLAKESTKTTSGSMCDLQCGFKFWIRKGFVYIIPWGEHGFRKGFRLPKYAVDYCYFNSTDKPDDISYSAWKTRERIWDDMIDNPYEEAKHRMICYVSDFSLLAIAAEVQVRNYMIKKYKPK